MVIPVETPFSGGPAEEPGVDVMLLNWDIDEVFAVGFNTFGTWVVCKRESKFDVGILLRLPGLAYEALSNQNHIRSLHS